jgi:hypothetical protein
MVKNGTKRDILVTQLLSSRGFDRVKCSTTTFEVGYAIDRLLFNVK